MSQDPKSRLHSNGVDFTKTQHHDTYDRINPEQFDLTGKAIFITGPSKGVGHAAALSYARAGASYIGLGARSDMSALEREIQNVAQKAGRQLPKTLALKLDVTSEESVASAAKELENAFGRLDVLVNNAGYLEGFLSVADSNVDDWWKVWDVNVRGVYLVTRAFLPLLLKGGMKTILNTSSIGAHLIMPGASGYQVSKLAVLRFGEFINAEYGNQGILCYGIHPGGVATELALNMPKEARAALVDKAELAGDAMVWLTAERREWLAGRYVSVNWDVDELLQKKDKIVKEDLLKVRLDVGVE
jgi:NAD(P)-dependent dehydrogenase (short-subunit alcohol dehydrogenase family)